MFDLKWRDKPLHTLDYEETTEFEKEMLKRLLSVNSAGMSDQIIQQLQAYIDQIRFHKAEQLELLKMGLDGKEEDEIDDTQSLIIGEPAPEPTEDEDE